MNQEITNARMLLANGQTEDAINVLMQMLPLLSKEHSKDLASISGEYHDLRKKHLKGIISFEQITLHENRIRDRLMGLILSMESAGSEEKGISAGVRKEAHKKLRYGLVLAGIVLFAALTYLIIFFYQNRTFSFIVHVQGDRGSVPDSILRKAGLKIFYAETIQEQSVRNNTIIFAGIPAKYRGEKISYQLVGAEGYGLKNNGEDYRLSDAPVFIYVEQKSKQQESTPSAAPTGSPIINNYGTNAKINVFDAPAEVHQTIYENGNNKRNENE